MKDSCATCVHGYDTSPLEHSMVYCAPQHNTHEWNYCCSGYRLITLKELDERSNVKFGKQIKKIIQKDNK